MIRGATGCDVRNTNCLLNNMSWKKSATYFKEISTGLSISCGTAFLSLIPKDTLLQLALRTLKWSIQPVAPRLKCPFSFFESARFLYLILYRQVSHGLGWPANAMFFYNRIREKQCFTLPVVNDNEIVRSSSDGEEGKIGLICLVRYIWNCWRRRVSQFLVTLDNG